MPVVMGTAGHIDHGKTSLVRALTGTDCDRLEEEKRRGITIELGFAYLPLPEKMGGGKLSIVDVPGHERFVKNMVSGAAGIDFVMLVVAADEGVMPQTREHLEICSLLGIQKGLVALTKTDMVDAEWLGLVTEDVKTFLQGSFLEGAPVFPVSSHTGDGMEALKAVLYDMAVNFNPKRRGDLPRLPVDRIFTMRGHGTVVTGTLISGSFRLGEDLVLEPSGLSSKVRGLQSHGSAVDMAPAGFRTAVNLPGLEVEQIAKGDVLTRPGALFRAESWMVSLKCLASSPNALKHRTEVHFHHGAREVQARLNFLDRDKLNPGETALCRVNFDEPMVGVFADRCVVRAFSPLRTVAGGAVIRPLPLDLRKKDPAYGRKLEILSELALKQSSASLVPEESIMLHLELSGQNGASFSELCVLTNLESSALEKSLQLLGSKQLAFVTDRDERRYLAGAPAEKLFDSCLAYFADFHKREPMKPGLSRSAALSGWGRLLSPKLAHFVLERNLKLGKIIADGEVLRLPEHKVSMAGGSAGLRDTLLKVYAGAGMAPPNIKEALEAAAANIKDAAPVLRLMQDNGELVKLNEDIYYSGTAYNEIQQKAVAWFASHDNLGVPELKEITGLSRKYLIALLEYFDKSKLTVRVGDKRVLRVKQG